MPWVRAIPEKLLFTLRCLALAVVGAALISLLLIALNLARFGPLRLSRWREPTWILYGALALFAMAREQPRAYLRTAISRVRGILESGRFFPFAAGICLALYLLSSATSHWSFHTFSHDFSMFDEALYQSHHGHFLFSPVLARSILSEHFAPVLALFVPLHALFSSPYLLVILNPLLLWIAVLPLRALLDLQGVSRIARNVACVTFLTNPITISALDYGFHVESLLPAAVFGVFLLHRRGPAWAYWTSLVLALAIKEDVGAYSVGLGAYLFVAERRRRRGFVTALAGLSWVFVALDIVSPRIPGAGEGYRFLQRWGQWGADPVGVVLGMISHPFSLAVALAASSYLLFFSRLLAAPFLGAWGWLLFAIPWVITATSGNPQHAQMSLYYGIPLLTYAGLASVVGLASRAGRRLTASRVAPALTALVIMLNVAHFSFPAVPPERQAVLAELARIPDRATVQAMSCFFPVLGYARMKTVLMPGEALEADYVVLRSSVTAWPFATAQVERLAREAVASGRYAIRFSRGGFLVLERR